MNPHKTQIGRMIEEVKKAMLAHFPIVYIPTNQKTLINDMLFDAKYTGCLMPRVCFASGFPHFLQFKSEFGNKEFMI